jgi:hypothetical protein
MSSTFQRAKERYQQAKDTCRREAAIKGGAFLGVEFYISGWSDRARHALSDQWLAEGVPAGTGWDWPEVFRRHNDPDRLDMAVWAPQDRLCGLGLCLTGSQFVEIRFVEGDPRQDCPLKGKRTLIFLECAAGYAQLRGKAELRIQPKNQQLEALYTELYGFSLETPRRGPAYYRKVV